LAITPPYVIDDVVALTFATLLVSKVRSFSICVDTWPPVVG
jgi:hypothetical protein